MAKKELPPKVELSAEEKASLAHMEAEEEVIADIAPEREAQGIEEQAKVEELRATIQNAKKAGDSEERRALARQRRPADE